jgi:hypothetical protein
MKQRVIKIKSPLRKFFREYLEAIRPMHNLPNHEARLLAELMYNYHILKRDMPVDKYRWKVLFDYDTKMEIRDYLGISGQALENKLTMLRRKEFIVDGKLIKDYIIDPENAYMLIYKWDINAEDSNPDNKKD